MNSDPDNMDPSVQRERSQQPPTLPLPSAWRLVVAAVVILAFLYLLYLTGLKEAEPAQSCDIILDRVVLAH